MPATKDTLDFIVIGAQKAGTTSLFEYLKRHPELCLAPGKEAPYFSNDVACARGWGSYITRTFALGDPALKWGTVTPQYMVGGVLEASMTSEAAAGYDERTVPLRIRARLPDVRLVAILRDPVARARSHHQMAVMNGIERRSFDEAIKELLHSDLLQRSRERPEEITGYVTWGEYGRILSGYLDVFPPEQILVVFTEELERAPEQFLRRVYEFLHVASDIFPENLGTRYRASGRTRRFPWLEPYTWLSPYGEVDVFLRRNPVVRALWHALPEAPRRRIYSGLADTAYRVDLWNRRGRTDARDEPTLATLNSLREHFYEDAHRLAALFGVTPPWHFAQGADDRPILDREALRDDDG
jgi:sulfotransferase family protein